MSLIAWLRRPGANGWGYRSTAEQVTADLDLHQQSFLLTGATSGLGAETLRVLVSRGAQVFATARSLAAGQAACATFGQQAIPIVCDLAEPASIRACIASIRQQAPKLSAIICNAGIMALPRLEQREGIELQFYVNHLGHFRLVLGLLDRLEPTGRVVMVSSEAHRAAPRVGIELDNLSGARGYGAWRAYGQSKLANLLFARALAARLPRGQCANALHPGVIRTKLDRHMGAAARAAWAMGGPLFMKSIPQGAATQCYLATRPELADVSGKYFANCNEATSTRQGQDLGLAERLWTVSEELTHA